MCHLIDSEYFLNVISVNEQSHGQKPYLHTTFYHQIEHK